MKAYTVKNDKIAEVPLDQLSKYKTTIWIRAINPSQKEIEFLAGITEAPIEEFKEFLEEDERPRLEVQNYLQLIYRCPYTENGEIITVPVTVFINKHLVVTIEKQKTAALDYIEALTQEGKRRFLYRKSPMTFLTYFVDKINDEFFAKIDKIADTVELFRERKHGLSREMTEKVYSLSVTLAFFNQSLLANIEVLNHLRKAYFRLITPKDKEHFDELYHDALQILDTEKVQREIVANLFNLQSVITSAKLNEFIKKLTLLALIMLVPTLLSGIFGMNVPLPFAHDDPFAFYYILFFMFLITVGSIGFFKYMKWF